MREFESPSRLAKLSESTEGRETRQPREQLALFRADDTRTANGSRRRSGCHTLRSIPSWLLPALPPDLSLELAT